MAINFGAVNFPDDAGKDTTLSKSQAMQLLQDVNRAFVYFERLENKKMAAKLDATCHVDRDNRLKIHVAEWMDAVWSYK